jgi:hypothetical protein
MVGKAMLIEPIMIEWVREPRMIDRLMAHLAEGDTDPVASGGRSPEARDDCVTGIRGTLLIAKTSLGKMSCDAPT